MTPGKSSRAFQRILVGLGAAHGEEAAIRTAIALGSTLHTGLACLFVEEDSLHNLSELPFAHAVSSGGAGRRSITPAAMRAALKHQASTCRRMIQTYAGRAGIPWTFDQVRGAWAASIRAAASSGDIVLLQSEAVTAGAGGQVALLRSVAQAAGALVIAGPTATSMTGPVLAIDDGDARGRQTVQLAARIAAAARAPLALLTIAASEPVARDTEARARSIAPTAMPVSFARLAGGTLQDIGAVLRAIGPRFVVADLEGEPFCDDTSAGYLVRQAGAPVILLDDSRGEEA